METDQFTERIQLLSVGSIAILLVIECYYFLRIPPATSYETSLVLALPTEFWILFYLITGLVILVHILSVFQGSVYWVHALVLGICNYALYFFLPVARGYRLYGRGAVDVLRHLGEVKELLATGALPGLWYPAQHILMSEIVMTGVPLEISKYVLVLVFTAYYILSVAILVGQLTSHRAGIVCGACTAFPLVYAKLHLSAQPAVFSFFFFPVILFVVDRHRRANTNRYLLLFGLFALLMIYFHPLSTILLVILLSSTSVFTIIYDRFTTGSTARLSVWLALILPPALFAWVINFPIMSNNVIRLYLSWAVTETTSAVATEVNEAAVLTPIQIAQKAVGLYGSVILYVGLAGLIVLGIVYGLIRRSGEPDFVETYLLVQFGMGFVLVASFLVGSFIVKGPIRAARYALLMATLLIAIKLLGTLVQRRTVGSVAIGVTLVLASVIGANAAYEPNNHLTYAEYEGVEFTTMYQNVGENVYSHKISNKMEGYVAGGDSEYLYPPTFDILWGLPPDLGYGSNVTVHPDAVGGTETATGTYWLSYIVTKDYDLRYHEAEYYTEDQQKQLEVYDQQDIDRLGTDRTVYKVYANGGFTLWRVIPEDIWRRQ